jgi:hypothetical protein
MGYFTSLMQQSGLRGTDAVHSRTAYSIESHVERQVEPQPAAVAPIDSGNAPPMQFNPNGLATVPRQRIEDGISPGPVPRQEKTPVSDSGRVEQPHRREVNHPLERKTSVERSIPEPDLSRSVREVATAHVKESVLPDAIPPTPLEQVSTKPAVAVRNSEAITFADVRAWVSADFDERDEEAMARPLVGRPGTKNAIQDFSVSAGGYTLEIGNIEVIVEAPAPPPAPQTPIPRPAPDHSWTLRSRHYLR